MFLKNKKNIFKTGRSKVIDYAALTHYLHKTQARRRNKFHETWFIIELVGLPDTY